MVPLVVWRRDRRTVLSVTPVLRPLPPTFAATRDALHAVAEHILAPCRYQATGHIGLRPAHQGFGTPKGEREVRVEADVLVDGRRREQLSTLRAAGEFLGITPGVPAGVYAPATPLDLDAPLDIDPDAARALGDWYGFCAGLLDVVMADADASDAPDEVQLWPEHFDIAMSLGPDGARANYGGSPGDGDHAEPYLYIGPWSMEGRDGEFWTESFGASSSYAALLDGADGLAFLRQGRELLRP
jgi:hypothetical protein